MPFKSCLVRPPSCLLVLSIFVLVNLSHQVKQHYSWTVQYTLFLGFWKSFVSYVKAMEERHPYRGILIVNRTT